ncbi:HEPN-associated N-terminal domain-containing protein [Microlunatus sp. Y2014]|uniref:HEPN-associated N-terminal domain-containing protein n=1 Tax=Microlunatus sp. Y2014 TaxID=3418488 RepID=UPI003DA78C97
MKRELEEASDRGWWSAESSICPNCVSDAALAQAITEVAGPDQCDFCDMAAGAAPFDVLLEAVVSGIRFAYEDPIEQVMYDSSEGGYQTVTFDTDELLTWELDVSDNGQVLEALTEHIEGDVWCERDPYRLPEEDRLASGWQRFRKTVTEARRFTFLIEQPDDDNLDDIPPVHAMPSVIADTVTSRGLVTELPTGTTWWRARTHRAEDNPRSAAELGTPPLGKASDNRMSPRGIAAFYGASTPECAKAEASAHTDEGKDRVSWGKFTATGPLTVVDLRSPPEVPSIFDRERREFRYVALFLRAFIADAIQPAPAAPIEYYPTQVIAEFLRYQVPASGLVWRSTQKADADCCVLFLSPDQQADLGSPEADQAVIVLDPETVRQTNLAGT